MQFRALPAIEHPLALLRPLREADLVAWRDYLEDPAVFEHTSWNHPTLDTLRLNLRLGTGDAPDASLRLAIASTRDDSLLGTIGFHTVSALNRSAELAYDLHPAAWGRGIASAACRCLTDWAHRDASIVRVQATVLGSNPRSMRVLERCGFEREGLLRSYRQVRGRAGDFFMFSHVRDGDR
jgi:ribosomal-protein-alanine N-acetyltransferase